MNETMTDAEIVAEFCAALKAHVDAARDVETTLTKQTVANLFTAQKRVKALSEGALGAALGEIDRLTAERDAARAKLAELIDRLTKLADENIRLDNEHESFGSMEEDIIATTWGAAGRELRAALGIESEATE